MVTLYKNIISYACISLFIVPSISTTHHVTDISCLFMKNMYIPYHALCEDNWNRLDSYIQNYGYFTTEAQNNILSMAIELGSLEIVEHIIDKASKDGILATLVSTENELGQTPLHIFLQTYDIRKPKAYHLFYRMRTCISREKIAEIQMQSDRFTKDMSHLIPFIYNTHISPKAIMALQMYPEDTITALNDLVYRPAMVTDQYGRINGEHLDTVMPYLHASYISSIENITKFSFDFQEACEAPKQDDHLVHHAQYARKLASYGMRFTKNPSISQLFLDNLNTKNTRHKDIISEAAFGTLKEVPQGISHDEIRDQDNMTPAMWAICQGYQSLANYLIDYAVTDVNQCDNTNMTLLGWASFHGNDTLVKKLLDKGASINIFDTHGNHPLTYTARRGSMHTVHTFLHHPRAEEIWNTAIATAAHQASCFGQNATASALFIYSHNRSILYLQ